MAELNLFSPSRDWLSHDYDSDCPVTTLIEVEEDPVSYVGEDLAGFVEHDPYYSEFGILDHVDLCASPQSVGEWLDLDSRVEAQAKHRILGRALPSHSPDYSTGSQNERGKENCGGHNHAVVTSPSKTGLLKQIPANAGGRFQRSGGEACAGGGIGLARRREEVLGKRSRAAAGAEEKEDSCGDAHHHHDPRERSSEAPRGVGGEEDCASTLERDRGKFKPHSIKASIFQVLEEAGPEGLQVSQIVQVTQERGMKDWRRLLTPKCTVSASCSTDSVFVRVAPGTFALRALLDGDKVPATPPSPVLRRRKRTRTSYHCFA